MSFSIVLPKRSNYVCSPSSRFLTASIVLIIACAVSFFFMTGTIFPSFTIFLHNYIECSPDLAQYGCFSETSRTISSPPSFVTASTRCGEEDSRERVRKLFSLICFELGFRFMLLMTAAIPPFLTISSEQSGSLAMVFNRPTDDFTTSLC